MHDWECGPNSRKEKWLAKQPTITQLCNLTHENDPITTAKSILGKHDTIVD